MEVLSPVKNFKTAQVAIMSGANAIYFSSDIFGARESAKNCKEEVRLIVEFAKKHYVKTYITLNTLIMNNEIDLFFKELDFLSSIGADAVIIQDYAYIPIVKNNFPLEVHCSTQMNINNEYGATFVYEQGASRVVLPREMKLDEIKNIVKVGIETEVFVHGALCTSYSGICLISSYINNRSGNRGNCSQICRVKSKLIKNGLLVNEDYMLSLKDLSLNSDIEKLKLENVTSVKIEGRLKQPEYTAVTTNVYRKLVEGEGSEIDLLNRVYNRRFTKGFINEVSSQDISNNKRVNNHGYYIGSVLKVDKGWVYVNTNQLIHQDKVRFIKDESETGQTIDVIEVVDDFVRFKSNCNVEVGSEVYRVFDYDIARRLKQNEFSYYKSHKLTYNIRVVMELGKPVKAFFEDQIFSTSSFLEAAKTAPLSYDKVINQLSKTNDYPFDFEIDLNYAEGFIVVSQLNNLRTQIYEFITNKLVDNSYNKLTVNYEERHEGADVKYFIEVSNFLQLENLARLEFEFVVVVSDDELFRAAKKYGYTVYKVFSNVVCESDFKGVDVYDGYVVSELGALHYVSKLGKPVITNYSLNTTNIINQQFLSNYAVKTMLSLEVENDDVNVFNEKYTLGFLYGDVSLMVMKYCLINKSKRDVCGNCRECFENDYRLEIGGKQYKLRNEYANKLSVVSDRPIYNQDLLNYNISYYMRFTDEENIDELIKDILNKRLSENKVGM